MRAALQHGSSSYSFSPFFLNHVLSFVTDESKPVHPMELQGLFRSPVSSKQAKIAPFKESSSLRQRLRRRATGGPKDFLDQTFYLKPGYSLFPQPSTTGM